MPRLPDQISEPLNALRSVFRNPDLRRLEIAFAGAAVGRYALFVSVSLYTYHAGGVTAVALVTVVRQSLAATVAPFAASLSDRFRRERVMLASDLGRVACSGGIALLASQRAPHLTVYTLAVASSIVGAVFKPAEAALMPTLARSPDELTAANVATSTFDSIGIFAGPALGAGLIALFGYPAAFTLVALMFAWSALFVARIASQREEALPGGAHGGGLAALVAGFRTVGDEPRLVLLIGLYCAQCFTAGSVGVLEVPMALRLLHMGNAGLGLLESACGVGAIFGAAVSLSLLTRARLGGDLALGLVLWGAPLLLIAAAPHPWAAVVALAVLGAGNSIVDVSAMTLVQRTAPTAVAGRVFGVLESGIITSMAVGALVSPALVHALGIRGALLVVGAILPALALLGAAPLAAVDRGATVPLEQIEALRTVPFLSPLPVQALEFLAARMRRVELAAGTTLFREGDHGDAFYVLDGGRLTIELPDRTKTENAPAYVGEIALLRDVPRTATVRAAADSTLWAIDRDDFLSAVTGHTRAGASAEAVVLSRVAPVAA